MTSEALTKSKAALADAAAMDVDLNSMTLPAAYTRLMDLAMVQAQVATAQALEIIADRQR